MCGNGEYEVGGGGAPRLDADLQRGVAEPLVPGCYLVHAKRDGR